MSAEKILLKGLIHRESMNSKEICGSKVWFSSPLLVYISITVLKNTCGVMSCQHKNFQNFKGPFLFWLYITWIHTISFAFPKNSFVCRKMGGSVGRMGKKSCYSIPWTALFGIKRNEALTTFSWGLICLLLHISASHHGQMQRREWKTCYKIPVLFLSLTSMPEAGNIICKSAHCGKLRKTGFVKNLTGINWQRTFGKHVCQQKKLISWKCS